MPQWEYRKCNLGDTPPRADDVDLLNAAGKEAWELVVITVNGIAYLKRPLGAAAAVPEASPRPAPRRRASPPGDAER
jgi:hypothetical protein